MLVIQKPSAFRTSFIALCVLWLAGCSDPASRALLKGEKLIQQRQYAKAATELETATRLLPRNAQAWNHLGLALHYQNQYAPAQQAYRQALAIDHNLASARFNLGNLLYEHNDFAAAVDQLTSYTFLQPRSVDAWLRLGSAQLQTRRYDVAERSFRAALELAPGSCEALNGLGNVAFYRRRMQDALNYFSRALALDTNYAPAVLNTAVIAHQTLNNRQVALQGYRNYLALMPQSQTADAVKVAATQLETELAPPIVTNRPPAVAAKPNVPTVAARSPLPQPATTTTTTTAPAPAPATAPTSTAPILVQKPATVPAVPSKPAVTQTTQTNKATQAPPKVVVAQSEIEVTRLPDDLVIRPVQDLGPSARRGGDSASEAAQQSSTTTGANVATGTDSSRASKPGLLARLNPFTPKPKSSLTDSGPRYSYISPARPSPGNRAEAEKQFAAAIKAQRAGDVRTAFSGYKKAAEIDPSYFEAHYNRGLAAYQMSSWQDSLRAYEYALAVRPDSVDARYNFALALKAANYLDDSAQQLTQILQAHPDESRAHLSLGNLCAYKLNQPQLAREHFNKVLEYDPQNPQASEIRFWLASHP